MLLDVVEFPQPFVEFVDDRHARLEVVDVGPESFQFRLHSCVGGRVLLDSSEPILQAPDLLEVDIRRLEAVECPVEPVEFPVEVVAGTLICL